MLWSLLINGVRYSEIEFANRPLPAAFGIEVRAAVQYEVREVFSDTDRVLAEIRQKIGNRSDAVFSPCRKYRYMLVRNFDSGGLFSEPGPRSNQFVAFCCLNPSTADEIEPDPTVTRCINYAKRWGFGGYVMLNAFAWRATDPKDMKAQPDPCGESNDAAIGLVASMAGMLVAGWGCDGKHMGRHSQLVDLLPQYADVYRLTATSEGYPGHPLYLKASLEPQLWLPKRTITSA